jgi:hypothetical protein
MPYSCARHERLRARSPARPSKSCGSRPMAALVAAPANANAVGPSDPRNSTGSVTVWQDAQIPIGPRSRSTMSGRLGSHT